MNQVDDGSSVTTDPAAPEPVGAVQHLRVGQLIEGRYKVLARLGAGRSGTVYRAQDCVLSEEIALKVLHPDLVDDPRALELFRREVKLARKIAHPNVCRVFDLGEADGFVFVTMEFVNGETLHAHIARDAGSVSDRLRLFEQIARGLAAVHAAGILHRDVKPENVLVREDGTAVLLNFGLAVMLDKDQSFSAFAGTPLHGSPEELSAEPIDFRSDLFALGLTGCELLTKYRPFGRRAPAVVISAILRDEQALLEIEGVSKPIALDLLALLLRMMTNGRPSAASVADALASLRKAVHPSRLSVRVGILALMLVVSAVVADFGFLISPDPTSEPPLSAPRFATRKPTDQQLIDYYLPMWKRFFLKKNAMSFWEFQRRITKVKPEIDSWNTGVTLRVSYAVMTDWAEVSMTDYLLINLYSTEPAWANVHLPRDAFLKELDIARILDNHIGSSEIQQVPPGKELKHARYEDAKASLRALTSECTLERTEIRLGRRTSGRLEMHGTCAIDERQNRCGAGTIDLVTGEGSFHYMRCWIE